MSELQLLENVQFVTAKGKRFAVLNAEDWEAFVDWLETFEDLQILKQSLAELKSGDRRRAGWLDWEEAKKEIQ
jgi:hypothetical protein